jgi:alkylation response protein AidB-like acyl-CoA dehydrogenase
MGAMSYTPPLRDLNLALDAAGVHALLPAFPDFDLETAEAVLEAAGSLCAEVLAPLNRVGDQQGSRLENGRVRTPDGFAEAFRAYGDGGWNGLSADPEFGGQGLPKVLDLAVGEMVNSANMAFALCPTLTAAAIEALQVHGSAEQKAKYLPRLISGEWSGTMQLTEPQAGSDLSTVRTVAEFDGAGGWRLTGQKIYITWGDHDCADNIVGMVLARTQGAAEGTRGLSLFVCPKRLVNDDGSLGEHNQLKPVSVEHKLGIHASPTCVMAYEGARAEMVGGEGQGLANMFVMMNAARIAVGAQGVGIAEAAFQRAYRYALERRQGRSLWSEERPAPIIAHPDVRRMLMLSKAKIEAARLICLSAGIAGDLARNAPDEETRRRAKLREELLTPIAKAWSTDVGVEVSSLAVQVHGGMGYIEETGAAQHYRDARIPPIYEGTNGIQANDLVGRKLAMDGGAAASTMIEEIGAIARGLSGGLESVRERLQRAQSVLQRASAEMQNRAGSDAALAGAVSFARLFGDVLGGALLAKQAQTAQARIAAGSSDSEWLRGKVLLARFYADQVLSGAEGLAQAALAGADTLREAAPELLAPQ